MAASVHGDESAPEYEIRPYAPGDRDDVRSLFELVWASERTEEWLVHAYETNPYVDGPSMIVADAGEAVVGARPFVPFPMRAGPTDLLAAYLNNAMVHPDHRRRGLFTRMMELTVRMLESRDVALLFNYANEKSAPGYRELGFDELGTGPQKSLRVQRPGRFVRDRLDTPVGAAVATVANAAMRGYHALRRLGTAASAEWQIKRRSGIPATDLALLAETHTPASLHTRREERLYRWLDADPHWEHETYLASQGASLGAALVVRTDSGTTPQIVDVVPPAPPARRDAVTALLDAVLATYRDAPAISVTGPVVNERLVPPDLLSAFGFFDSDSAPLSRVTAGEDTAFLSVTDAADPEIDVLDPEHWRVRVR